MNPPIFDTPLSSSWSTLSPHTEEDSVKRLLLSLTIVVLAGAAWRAFEPFRIKHPASGKEITVPGPNGANALLVSGWKTTR